MCEICLPVFPRMSISKLVWIKGRRIHKALWGSLGMGAGGGVFLRDSFKKTRKAGVKEERLEEVVKRLKPNMKGLLDICLEGLCLSIREMYLSCRRSQPYRPEVN